MAQCIRSRSTHVTPFAATKGKPERTAWLSVLVSTYNWGLWSFLVVLLFAQVFGIFWSTVTSVQHVFYGQTPSKGLYSIEGYNDEPYSDRMIACVLQGRLYKPIQLAEALRSSKAVVVDTNGTAINGYRVCARNQIQPDSTMYSKYAARCDAIAATMDGIFDSCSKLGYNITRDALRIVEDVQSSTMRLLTHSLPVLIMPYWDDAVPARYAVPGWDGSACVFRLSGKYDDEAQSHAYLRGISRSLREKKTSEWLGRPGGVWRNGWYEDATGMKWYSDLITSDPTNEYNILQRQFDTITGTELDRANASAWTGTPSTQPWGDSLAITETELWMNSIAVSNGSRYGLFLYEAAHHISVVSRYSIDTLVSNLSLGLLLLRWLISIVAFQNSVKAGASSLVAIGAGSVSGSRYFSCLPLVLLPRLKTTFAAFCSIGCQFEGEQKALAETWFVVYPAIGEFALFYFSVLSLLAKLLGRRINDVLFGPTLVFFSFMHFFRFALAQSGWFEFDGRISTVVLSADFDEMRLLDFFTTDAALRMNGNIKSLFLIKIAVLGLNLVPFCYAKPASRRCVSRGFTSTLLEIEDAVAIRAYTVGGLGRAFQYDHNRNDGQMETIPQDLPPPCDARTSSTFPLRLLSCYELVRLGYVVLGEKYLISVNDWLWFMLVSPLRSHQPFSNLNLCVYTVKQEEDGTSRVDKQPHFCWVGDPKFKDIRCLDISLRQFR